MDFIEFTSNVGLCLYQVVKLMSDRVRICVFRLRVQGNGGKKNQINRIMDVCRVFIIMINDLTCYFFHMIRILDKRKIIEPSSQRVSYSWSIIGNKINIKIRSCRVALPLPYGDIAVIEESFYQINNYFYMQL